jgi:iron complex transport system substrate-binding protein
MSPTRAGGAPGRGPLAVLCALLAGAAGCSAPASDTPVAHGPEIDNCGVAVPAGDPPRRVFAAYHNAVEMAHALGLGDRLVGTAFLDNTVLPEYADAQAAAPYYPALPSKEELLRLEPDFVVSGYGSFTDDAFGSRADLADLGVRTWQFTSMCPTEDGLGQEALVPGDVTMDDVYADIEGLGEVTGTEERAAEVVAGMRADIEEVTARLDGVEERPRVAVVSFEEDGIRVLGGNDIATEVIELAGAENVFADVSGRLTKVGVEELVSRDPEVLLFLTCCGEDVDESDAGPRIAEVRADPALADVPAVRDDRLHGFTFATSSAGVRSADAVAQVAGFAHPDLFG